ncbi:malonate decarboxylase subunit epsilon [Brevibacillus fluminis]|uniref:malonate decarboxylase subunit epsilon n=1 Tax=Brevibacillus fluminis TaxID=511487 RepID=UPI003F889A02
MNTAFLFPGQGSQRPNMLHDLPEHSDASRTLQEASEVLGEDILTYDTAEKLQSTRFVQLSLLVAGVAVSRALQAEGAIPDMVAGHSVGAFGAAVAAGSLAFQDAIALVKLRGELMEQAYPNGYGMGVILGLSERRVHEQIERCSTADSPVYVANLNAPDQITVSGVLAGLDSVLAHARVAGARKAQLLHVSVPSHCVLMEGVARQLEAALERIPLHTPRIPYAGNRTARLLRTAEAIREDLAASVAAAVRWHDATSLLYELGARLFVEMPPGHVLTDLAAYAFPDARCVAIAERGVKAAVLFTRRMSENG